MSNQDEFHDPSLNQDKNGVIWYVRKACRVAFYEENDDVGFGDFLLVYGVFIGVFLLMLIVTSVHALYTGTTGQLASEFALRNLLGPEAFAGSLLMLVVGGPPVAVVVSFWKLFHGDIHE
jgi:hypothetical protein